MSKTRHINRRMSQRGITKEMLELAVRFGEPVQDKTVLTGSAAKALINELDRIRRKLTRIVDKGGLVVVTVDDRMITTYDVDSYKAY